MQDKRDAAHIGQIRVSFEYDKCAEATIIAQQIPGDKPDITTFKAWDPDNTAGKDKMYDDDEEDGASCFGMVCCYLCMCVSGCFSMMFEDTMDHAADGNQTSVQYFRQSEKQLEFTTKLLRFCGVFFAILGFYLIFTPIIVLLNWIPLIGAFLSTIAVLAAFLIALVCGLTLSLANIAIAWLLFRPFLALGLLSLVGIGTYFLCFW